MIPQAGADLLFATAPQGADCEALHTSVVPLSNPNGAGMTLEPLHFDALTYLGRYPNLVLEGLHRYENTLTGNWGCRLERLYSSLRKLNTAHGLSIENGKSNEDFPRGIGLKIVKSIQPSIEDIRTQNHYKIWADRR